ARNALEALTRSLCAAITSSMFFVRHRHVVLASRRQHYHAIPQKPLGDVPREEVLWLSYDSFDGQHHARRLNEFPTSSRVPHPGLQIAQPGTSRPYCLGLGSPAQARIIAFTCPLRPEHESAAMR